jgi:hypothetical protein
METSREIQVEKKVDPSKIFQVGMGFFASKTLLTAVKIELFTILANQWLSGQEIRHRLNLNERSLYDFLDTLVALGFLQRKGFRENASYANSPEAEIYLDKCRLTYIGGILEMANNRLYPSWNHLEEALRTGKPQNELRSEGIDFFEQIYSDKSKTREFINAMGGAQMGNFIAFAERFDFTEYSSLCDIGGAGAQLSAMVTMRKPQIHCKSFDLPAISPIALENISKMGLADKIEVVTGDFFKDPFPHADIITMGNILHDWGTRDKIRLIQKAYEALHEGGSFVVIESIIDNERRENAFGLLMSLNMLIETQEGYNFSAEDFNGWAKEAGFSETYVLPLSESSNAVVAVK